MWHIWEREALVSYCLSLGVYGGGTAPTALQPLRWGWQIEEGEGMEGKGEGREEGKGGNIRGGRK